MTVPQRSKEHAHDYRYFPEPDLPPLEIGRSQVEAIRASLPELPAAKSQRFVSEFGLTPNEARLLTSDRALVGYYEAVLALTRSPAKVVNNWVAGEFLRNVNELGTDLDAIPVPPEHLAGLIDLVTGNTINANTAREVLEEMFTTGRSPQEIVKARDLGQISDASALEDIVTQILRDNPGEVAKFLAGKETVFQWLMGQVARATKGKADPQVARALLTKALATLKAKK